jgi:hypothetical protein
VRKPASASQAAYEGSIPFARSSPLQPVKQGVPERSAPGSSQIPKSLYEPHTRNSPNRLKAGTATGMRWLSQTAARFVLAGILLAAGIQLFFS